MILQKTVLILIGTCSVFFGFPNPFIHVPFVILFYPIILYRIGISSEKKFCPAFWAGMGAPLSLYWIAVAAHVYGGFPWLLAIPCSFLLGSYIALWGSVFSLLISHVKYSSPLIRCVAAGILWYILEWLRGFFLTGFPWLTVSSSFAAWPIFLQPLSVLGEYAYSGFLVFISFLFYEGIINLCTSNKGYRSTIRIFSLSAFCIFAATAYSIYRFETVPNILAGKGTPLSVSLIQGNISQDIKWTEAERQKTINGYIRLTLNAVKNTVDAFSNNKIPSDKETVKNLSEYMGKITLSPDIPITSTTRLIIWPETAMPFLYGKSALGKQLDAFANDMQIPLLFGVLTSSGIQNTPAKLKLYNSAVLIHGKDFSVQCYNKEHLVPFGEYLPPPLDLKILQPLLQGLGGFTSGENDGLPILKIKEEKIPVGLLICYEAIFPESARKKVQDGAQFFINLSNDAWYEKTSAPIQHLQLSLMRSVEQCRYTARATNTGITAICDPLGGVYHNGTKKLFSPDFLNGNILLIKEHTLYYYLHPFLPFIAFLILLYLFRKPLKKILVKKTR